MALVSVSADLPQATVNESKGEMSIKFPGGVEVYTMTVLPPATAGLVEAQKTDILKGIGLKDLITNLNRASDLLFLAYMCTWGTGELQARIATRQSELLKLCGECVLTIDALKKASNRVLNELLEAYSYLLEADEAEALDILARCATHAKTMAAKCQKLKDGFGSLREETVKDKVTAIVRLGEQNVELEKLEKEQAVMKAKKEEQIALNEESNKAILKLEQDIVKEEAKEESAANRELALSIVGALAGAVGAVAGAVVKVKTLGMVGGPSSDPDAGKSSGPSSKQQLDSKEASVKTTKNKLTEAEEEEVNATEEKKAVSKRLFEAGVEKKKEQTRLDEAESAEAKKEAKAALEASAAKLEKLEDEQRKNEERLKKAERKKQTALEAYEGAAAGLASLQDSLKEMAQGQRDRVKELATHRLALVSEKIKKEEERRKSLGELAFLTSSLNSNVEVVRVGKSAQEALDIAVWAIANIEVSLNSATVFWNSMQTCCEELATPEAREKIQRLVDGKKTPEQRIKFYTSRRFVPIAVTYICKWTALISVCGDYYKASLEAEKSVAGHIRQSPNQEEAKKLILPLKTRLKEDYEREAAESDTAKEALEAEKLAITDETVADA